MSKTSLRDLAEAKMAWINAHAREDRLTGNMVTLTGCKRRPSFLAILEVLYT